MAEFHPAFERSAWPFPPGIPTKDDIIESKTDSISVDLKRVASCCRDIEVDLEIAASLPSTPAEAALVSKFLIRRNLHHAIQPLNELIRAEERVRRSRDDFSKAMFALAELQQEFQVGAAPDQSLRRSTSRRGNSHPPSITRRSSKDKLTKAGTRDAAKAAADIGLGRDGSAALESKSLGAMSQASRIIEAEEAENRMQIEMQMAEDGHRMATMAMVRVVRNDPLLKRSLHEAAHKMQRAKAAAPVPASGPGVVASISNQLAPRDQLASRGGLTTPQSIVPPLPGPASRPESIAAPHSVASGIGTARSSDTKAHSNLPLQWSSLAQCAQILEQARFICMCHMQGPKDMQYILEDKTNRMKDEVRQAVKKLDIVERELVRHRELESTQIRDVQDLTTRMELDLLRLTDLEKTQKEQLQFVVATECNDLKESRDATIARHTSSLATQEGGLAKDEQDDIDSLTAIRLKVKRAGLELRAIDREEFEKNMAFDKEIAEEIEAIEWQENAIKVTKEFLDEKEQYRESVAKEQREYEDQQYRTRKAAEMLREVNGTVIARWWRELLHRRAEVEKLLKKQKKKKGK